jgi:ComF family protein
MQGSFFPKEKIAAAAAATRRAIIDILFPKACVGCDCEGKFLCDQCLSAIPRKIEHDCPFCPKRTPLGTTCLSCSRHHALDGLFSVASFRKNRTIGNTIHVMKYEFVDELGGPLGQLLADVVSHSELLLPDIIVPIPLHPWRLRFRGFNQSSLIARSFSEYFSPDLGIPVREDILNRARFTLPQARSHSASERRENLRGAFVLTNGRITKATLLGATVWLIDDVATTGATLEECAKILKKAGAKKVLGVVLAR